MARLKYKRVIINVIFTILCILLVYTTIARQYRSILIQPIIPLPIRVIGERNYFDENFIHTRDRINKEQQNNGKEKQKNVKFADQNRTNNYNNINSKENKEKSEAMYFEHLAAIKNNKLKIASYKLNWTGDCPYPTYIDRKLEKEIWFSRFLDHLHAVDLSPTRDKSRNRTKQYCARWWHGSPQPEYSDLPHRKLTWKEPTKLDQHYIRPNCTFGQETKAWTNCSKTHNKLWRQLDKLGALYFPRSGTELGIVRGSTCLSSDGDVDIFVDIPQEKLYRLLRGKLDEGRLRVSGRFNRIEAEIHWIVKDCPTVHLVFNDWITDEMTKTGQSRPNHESTCNCYMDSARLTCHKNAKNRMYTQYGPSWFLPLRVKYLDIPHLALRSRRLQRRLSRLVSSRKGVIYQGAVAKLDLSITLTRPEREMVLAQLNVLWQAIKNRY